MTVEVAKWRSGGVAKRNAGAFSLIEILIAVLILGLGLLGLGALFPVVLRQQRIGTENITGVVVSNAAKAALLNANHFDAMVTTGGANRQVWRDWKNATDDQVGLNNDTYEQGEWFIPETDDRGMTFLGAQGTNSEVPLPVTARLYPFATGVGTQPQFVWDVAVQRVADTDLTNTAESDRMRAVIFVRRIDGRIRVTPGTGRTLLRALVDRSLPTGEHRVPVGVTEDDVDGLPTFDGTDGAGGLIYSRPVIALEGTDFTISSAEPRYIAGVNANNAARTVGRFMALPNQRLVDNLGNVYTVEVIEEDPNTPGRSRLRISPPLPPTAFPGSSTGGIREFILTPQIPSSVLLVEVKS